MVKRNKKNNGKGSEINGYGKVVNFSERSPGILRLLKFLTKEF
jgi:hypothetical protein